MYYYVYVLQSEKDHQFYVGFTKNIQRRLIEHNKGKNKSTKCGIPWKLIYKEKHKDRISARKREKFLKSYSGVKEKREIIKNYFGIV